MAPASHPTRRRVLRSATVAAVGLALWPAAFSLAADDKPGKADKKRVLFFTKSSGFEHSVIKRSDPNKLGYAEQILTDLGAANGFDVTCSKDGGLFTPDSIAKFDAFVFYTTGDLTTAGTDKNPPMSKDGKAAFLQSIKDGKGFMALHSGSDTFHSPGHSKAAGLVTDPAYDPYVEMLGGEFIIHGAQQKAAVKLVDPKFPGAPADGWEMQEEWYSLKNFSPDLHVIFVQETAGMKGDMYQRKPYPETWARMHGKGRVFFSSMGHREDVWKNDRYIKLLTGAMNWVTGKVEADVTPNYETAAPGSQLPKRPAAAGAK